MKKNILILSLISISVLGLSACQGKRSSRVSPDEFGSSSSVAGMKTIYFDFDQANIRDDQTEGLSINSDFLKKNSGVRVTVEGHCDERGTNEYNLALGDRRARTTKDYLVNLGVDPARLSVMSFGEEKPSCYEHDESCWWQNRKAAFVK